MATATDMTIRAPCLTPAELLDYFPIDFQFERRRPAVFTIPEHVF